MNPRCATTTPTLRLLILNPHPIAFKPPALAPPHPSLPPAPPVANPCSALCDFGPQTGCCPIPEESDLFDVMVSVGHASYPALPPVRLHPGSRPNRPGHDRRNTAALDRYNRSPLPACDSPPAASSTCRALTPPASLKQYPTGLAIEWPGFLEHRIEATSAKSPQSLFVRPGPDFPVSLRGWSMPIGVQVPSDLQDALANRATSASPAHWATLMSEPRDRPGPD